MVECCSVHFVTYVSTGEGRGRLTGACALSGGECRGVPLEVHSANINTMLVHNTSSAANRTSNA